MGERRSIESTVPGLRELPELEHPLEDGWALPAGWYSDPAVLAAERELIFRQAWQYAGRTEQAAAPGSFFATQAGHIPVVVTRDREGVLRGFVNVCRHRGHLVAEGEGCRESLQCPYHAWTYGLDGTLRRAPRAESEPGFDLAELSLLPVAVDTWGPFVFVSPDPEAGPLADALGELPRLLSDGGIDLDRLRFHSHWEVETASNWKVALENFLECYHCPVAHPGFSRVIDVSPDAYRLEISPTFSSQFGVLRKGVPRGQVEQAQYHLLWPNTTVNVAPGPANVAIERWLPAGPGRTIEVTDYFFGDDVPKAEIDELIEWDSQVGNEDIALVESVQAGLDTGAVAQGRLLLGSERLVHDFQRRVFAALAVG